MTKYANSKIYKIEPIVEHYEGDIYIGSTTQKYLSDRMSSHRNKYKLWKDGKDDNKYSVFDIFQKYGVENCNIYLIENYPCESKNELHAKEGYYIKMTKCVNKNIAGRTVKQWFEDHKEQIQEYKKEYYSDHKEEKKEYDKEYRQIHSKKIKDNLKLYRENNKAQISLKAKKAYNKKVGKHDDEIVDYKHPRIVCECGASHAISNTARHTKTKKHQDYLNNL